MKINILTLFPGILEGAFKESILHRAIQKKILDVNIVNIRDFALDKHHTCDDAPYGGGPGMVLKTEPIIAAYEGLAETGVTILLTPQGQSFNHRIAKELSEKKTLSFICGHYEGIDERVKELIVDMELSIGDFVTTGGEIPCLVVIDALVRLIPGVVGNYDSVKEDSFYESILDYPHYTRPAEFRGVRVPDVLLSGNHAQIKQWRWKQALKKTMLVRPDILKKLNMSKEAMKLLEEV
ncbi:tRNA (guanosine(37)-N1)-methyltransferase TrmD [Candidatus Desantisbacteria bacterium CG2_30_40_21]|uniref:tRNA (guanine-N(1)-)-methyltransferase n=5 Tax=unclassified Candidatus Desantisiibacteriota TaxID=3106372 RepID=A0A2M7JD07_9BACT|nr:MAG: tRNA (guanosine(37)-N1)-methyltransferase TrmD [Candidatus Desantisbacteria bacterium CG2_30_40_21]PIP42124.1 MAG: tRNA (guanosine(37)-N1)-methyltransferase TrmD [Candidatus Desantisbacteria bacterium CG23_combo_of_CG06-09_8_20_14_all_40_23]PIX17305.1 MAG: tRNA (guanosine(37)-N1)-methyltransferase TrmD [Candidatus Desantisbacteria bacterium CG_4_8_14_3_um_filter_40_12]PIY20082.1 MAG: tRNA (guanosine(37)-N1)-methyltransferase TrmD [Candidatus Desantisbacteria bacterium CG_4_10_14_3_um_fil